ncbi:uncharacterized protein SAPINGB_P001519 [Magnusiomyces paraingens]|uniref:Cell wall protein CWP1 n=1 Tax=Magnusiomyces paraingens TaxID=2606893 RepID=A0A5E8B6Q2_9ASCO|nr:uncharacterized protein SAPINGB_P001519 [Saprochaete ingens]VVT47051.1 unnamed protein product [Saprochaete ingens]
MKFSAIAIAAIAALVEATVPVGTTFGLISIHSASPVHLISASINSKDEIVLASLSDPNGYLTAVNVGDGSIAIEGTKLYLGVSSDKTLIASTTPSKIFSFDGDRLLAVDGSSSFTAVSEGTYYSIFSGSVTTDKTSYSISLLITSAVTGASSSSSSESSSVVASVTQSAPAEVSTIASNTTVAQVNGAGSAQGSVFAAALAAVGGALLL